MPQSDKLFLPIGSACVSHIPLVSNFPAAHLVTCAEEARSNYFLPRGGQSQKEKSSQDPRGPAAILQHTVCARVERNCRVIRRPERRVIRGVNVAHEFWSPAPGLPGPLDSRWHIKHHIVTIAPAFFFPPLVDLVWQWFSFSTDVINQFWWTILFSHYVLGWKFDTDLGERGGD